MVLASVINQLSGANIPKYEIANIIHNLEELEKAGAKPKNIVNFVKKLIKKDELRQKFISDYKIGFKELGIKLKK